MSGTSLCLACWEVFESKMALRMHKRNCTKESYYCRRCGLFAFNKKTLEKHESEHWMEGVKSRRILSISLVKTAKTKAEGVPGTQDDQVSNSGEKAPEAEQDRETRGGSRSGANGRSLRDRKKRATKRTIHECDTCDEVFDSAYNLRKHMCKCNGYDSSSSDSDS